jgi:hypothetical protein
MRTIPLYPFRERNKGERYDKRVLPTPCFEHENQAVVELPEETVIGKVQVHSEFMATPPMYADPIPHERLIVTLTSGLQVPAYRIKSPDNSFCICQDFSHKIAQ